MHKLTAHDAETQSLDGVADNIAKLTALFPEILTEGADGGKRVDFEALRELLGTAVEDKEERYNFTWHGKREARRLAQTPSTGTLRPYPAESKHWDSTQNLFIEGDNLEVLKLLQKSYHQRVKMIYIDPPYNTGKDFIYPDNYRDNIANYLELTGQTGEDGRKLAANPETSGRYHTHWLNMMYPRLKLARNLLRDDGVIFISIDDTEVANLRKLCDEIFGEENFIAEIIWQRSKKGDAKLIAGVHEHILCFAKSKEILLSLGIWRKPKEGADNVLKQYQAFRVKFSNDHEIIRESMMTWYKSLADSDPRKNHKHYNWSDDRGLYFAADFAGPDDGRASRPQHDIFHPITGKSCKKPSTGWRWDEEKTKWALEQNPPRIHFGLDESTIPNRKSYLEEISTEPFASVFYRDGRSATLEVERLVGKGLFQFPKNTEVLLDITRLVTGKTDTVLDFFAGSGTTAHAVMALNAEDGGNRKFIMVQLPEPTDKPDYPTIADIGKERIRRAGEKILADKGGIINLDVGFKVFKLDSTNIKPWDVGFDDLETSLPLFADSLKDNRSNDDVLYEILLKYGLDLSLPITTHTLAGKTVYSIGMGALIVCLDKAITLDTVEGIAKLKDELQPEDGMMRVVFRDSGFADDVVKVNAVQILKQAGIEDVRSV